MDTSEFTKGAELIASGTVGDGAAVNGGPFRTGMDKFVRRDEFNAGFRARQVLASAGKQLCMLLPLSSVLGSHRDINTVTFGIKHTYILDRADASNSLHRSTAAGAGKFTVSHLSIWMPKVEPSVAVQTDIEGMLISGARRQLYFEQMRVYRQQFGKTVKTTTWKVTTNSSEELPRHIFITFASTERDNSQVQNNQVFDNASVTRLSAWLNSRQYPERELETDFTTTGRNYTRAYMMLQEAMNKYMETDSGSQVSVEDFASLYPIFHIDVSKHHEKLKMGSVDIDLKWTLSKNFRNLENSDDIDYHVYCVILSDRYLTLDAVSGKMNIIV